MTEHVEEQIRRGLRLLAEDVQPPDKGRASLRLGRALAVAVAVVAIIAATAFGVLGRGHGTQPHFLADPFNYQPGSPGGGIGLDAPTDYITAGLSSVSAASRDVAWIVGSGPCCNGAQSPTAAQHSLAWRWNGAAWRSVPTPLVSHAYPNLSSVATIDSGNAWAVGSARTFMRSGHIRRPGPYHALIEHWDGSRWNIVQTPPLGWSSLGAVSAAGPRNIWAVGEHLLPVGRFRREARIRPLVLHWDGAAWHRVHLPWAVPGLTLDQVVVVGPSSVWVAGNRYQDRRRNNDVDTPILEYWDGARWHAVRAPFGPHDPFADFTATSGSDAWAVGSYRSRRSPFSRPLAAHWNGSDWQIAPVPNRAGKQRDSYFMDVVAVRSNDVWAVGQSWWGAKTAALLEHWDGQNWQVMPGAAPQIEGGAGLAVANDGTAWAIASSSCDNIVLRWNSDVWAVSSHPQDRSLDPHLPNLPQYRLPRCKPLGGWLPGPTGATGPTG